VLITVGNGQRIRAKASTDIDLGTNIRLNNVFLVPNVSANLVSVAQALDHGIDEVSFTRDGVRMLKGGAVVATGTRSGNLFTLDIDHGQHAFHAETAVIPSADISTWHQRLGHISFRSIRHLHAAGLIRVTGTAPTRPCHACAVGKMSRFSFSSARPTIRSTHVGEVIHSDVCGIFGERFNVTFIDDFRDTFLFTPF
jgi:hypothetical protein